MCRTVQYTHCDTGNSQRTADRCYDRFWSYWELYLKGLGTVSGPTNKKEEAAVRPSDSRRVNTINRKSRRGDYLATSCYPTPP